jgi:hypothetical protein
MVPKFVQINRMLSNVSLENVSYLLVCDDDVILPSGFLDEYLACVQEFNFALAQPARTHSSHVDWPFVEQLDGLRGRQTRFVEIGPVISIRRDLFGHILPFDESTPMGWGFDFVWPSVVEAHGLEMGIIDATPVAHSLRRAAENYEHRLASQQQEAFLQGNVHLTRDEAFTILRSFP